MKLKQLLEDLRKAKEELVQEEKLCKTIQKQGKDILKTIDSYYKKGAILLLEDLDEDLVKKLQSLTEDSTIVIFCKDGTRVEIRSNEAKYKKDTGAIR